MKSSKLSNQPIIDLFSPPDVIDAFCSSSVAKTHQPSIPGLIYSSAFIADQDQSSYLKHIDDSFWMTNLRRRVQHYGWRYDYRARKVDETMYLGQLPTWANDIAEKLYDKGITGEMPDQLIVNEYMPGQGIAQHIDCKPCFGDTIVSISLGSSCVMDLISIIDGTKHEINLESGSLLAMSGEARYEWSHGISARKVDSLDGKKIARERRVSLTFRTVRI